MHVNGAPVYVYYVQINTFLGNYFHSAPVLGKLCAHYQLHSSL